MYKAAFVICVLNLVVSIFVGLSPTNTLPLFVCILGGVSVSIFMCAVLVGVDRVLRYIDALELDRQHEWANRPVKTD